MSPTVATRIVGAAHVERDVWHRPTRAALAASRRCLSHPDSAEQVRELVAWAYANDVAILPGRRRTGFSGGIVPVSEGPALAIALDRLSRVRSFDPLLWRMEVEAGVTTATVQRLARENGLLFPPDPGAAEQSQIGGNLATNAGGPHAFKYGVTSRWVTGVEAVIAPGELVRFGGPVRKDAAGYDLRGLLIGSEGTLGIITAAWLRLTPAPAMAMPVIGGYDSIADGSRGDRGGARLKRRARHARVSAGLCLRHAPPPFLDAGDLDFMVICEAESEHERDALLEALGPTAATYDPREVWRWRGGVSMAVRAVRGEKLSEDIAVPLDRLREAIERTLADRRRSRSRDHLVGPRRRRQPALHLPL